MTDKEEKMNNMDNTFEFEPAAFVPFRDKEVLEYVRTVKREDMEKHPNPDFKIKIVPDPSLLWISDMVLRIRESDEQDKKLVMIMPNPAPALYASVAEIINRFRIDCRNVYTFNMDEWADDEGRVAPESYEAGFNRSFLKYFYGKIDPKLRMKRENCCAPTTENIGDYSKLIAECGDGGADICYSGPGWAGHIAFIDPDTEEFAAESIEEFLKLEARIVTLNPLTVMQNSLHGCFGCSGDIAKVPTKAATIGPADVVNSRNRLEMHCLTTMGSSSSWQRMISRLVLYGPVTMQVPSSILQLMATSVYVSEEIAKSFSCWEDIGY
jgi:6-phosphogluconolactonase/glucosamine-6-phosphate isomerase/deaminase